MEMESKKPRRLRRLQRVWADGGDPMYFLTLCTAGRERVLARDQIHDRFRLFTSDSLVRYGWWVSCYVLMPDHVHLFARSNQTAKPLGEWVKALKSVVSRREFKWQSGFFDHVLRTSESASEKWEYIKQNPVRAGLAGDADRWPYWGAFHPANAEE
jgi:putative transposase